MWGVIKLRKIIELLHKKRILIFIPVLFLIPYISSFSNNELDLLSPEFEFPVYSYSDTSTTEGDGDNGNSVVSNLERKNKEIHYTYRLGDKYLNRYAGIIIKFKKGHQYFDISKYDIMELELDPLNSKVLKPILMTFKDGFTKHDYPLTCRYSEIDLDLFKDKTTYSIKLKDFITPVWWYELNKISKTESGKETYRKLAYMKFESSLLSPINEDQSLIIKSLVLKKDQRALIFFLIIITCLFYLIYFISLKFFQKKTNTQIIPYEKIDAQNHADSDLKLIVECIAKEYKNSELTVKDIAEMIGLSSLKVSSALQNSFDNSFKGYLNTIRIEEAKRLLRETDWQISEIFYKVGYKNTTHFNRVFKQLNNMTPKEYRTL